MRRGAATHAALATLVTGAAGCRTVVDTVAGVFGPGEAGETLDAHVVYRLRPDCPTLLARTMRNGYTVMAPIATLGDGSQPSSEVARDDIEESGLFEGPVRTGEVVFRYLPPSGSDNWNTLGIDVIAEVEAVQLDLKSAHARLIERCGPDVEGEAADTVPRIPGQ